MSKILLSSGSYFDFENPENTVFSIYDIAHALSKICRYTGHCSSFYSVAQHSVLVSHIVPEEDMLSGLLHDAAESFIGDVAKPLKMLLPDYQAIEKRVEKAVFSSFNLDPHLPDSVKYADLVLLRTEQRDLMNADNHRWDITKDVLPLEDKIVPVPPNEAYLAFLNRYKQLTRVIRK